VADGTGDRRQRLGRRGESAAEAALTARGLRVIGRRVRTRGGEIDLVALDGPVVVFVEVKTRRGTGYGSAAAAVTPRKQRRLARLALGYLARREWLERSTRFDVVEVYARGDGSLTVRHVEDAFRLWPGG
jgi:putative endonuclease